MLNNQKETKMNVSISPLHFFFSFIFYPFLARQHLLCGNVCACSFSENCLHWLSWKASVIILRQGFLWKNKVSLKKKIVFLWVFKCFPFFPPVVGHVRRRFVSPEISFKRKYCRCLRSLPCKGNLISILTSDFNSWERGSDWKIRSWWIL